MSFNEATTVYREEMNLEKLQYSQLTNFGGLDFKLLLHIRFHDMDICQLRSRERCHQCIFKGKLSH